MAELQEQLQAILGNPQAMGQITAIARALTGGGGPEPPADGEPQSAPPTEGAPTQDYLPVDPPQGQDQAQAPQLDQLLGALGGGDGLAGLDPRLLQIALRVYGEYSAQDDQKAALLAALKPFLRAERREKLEKAEKIARLSRVVRVAIRLLREEGGEHV